MPQPHTGVPLLGASQYPRPLLVLQFEFYRPQKPLIPTHSRQEWGQDVLDLTNNFPGRRFKSAANSTNKVYIHTRHAPYHVPTQCKSIKLQQQTLTWESFGKLKGVSVLLVQCHVFLLSKQITVPAHLPRTSRKALNETSVLFSDHRPLFDRLGDSRTTVDMQPKKAWRGPVPILLKESCIRTLHLLLNESY